MASTRVFLEAIAKDAKLKIEHTGIAHIPILVQIKDAEPKAVLERIAVVTDAQLEAIEGGYRLSRGNGRRQAAAAEEAKDLAERIQPGIQERKKALEPYANWNDQAVQERADRLVSKVEESMKGNGDDRDRYVDITFGDNLDLPSSLVLRRLLELPPSTWVGEPGNVIRLSDQPNRYQKRLNANLAPVYAEYVTAHNRMQASTQARIQNPRITFGMDNRALSSGDVTRTVALANWVYQGYLGLTVLLVDRSGNVVGKTSTSIPLSPAKGSATAYFEGDKTEVELSPTTLALAKTLQFEPARSFNGSMSMMSDNVRISLGDSIRVPKAPSAVLDRLCAELDPFEDIAGKMLRTRAKAKGQQLVASLPGALFGRSLRLASKDKIKISDFGRTLAEQDMTVVEEGGWLTVRPRLSVDIERDTVDRAALRTLCQELRKQGYGRIDQLAIYANSRFGRFERNELDYYWLRGINAVEASRLEESQDAFRLYARLPENLRREANFRGEATGTLAQLVNDRLTTFIGTAVVIGMGTAISMSSQPTSNALRRFDLSESLSSSSAVLDLKQTTREVMFVQRDSESSGRFLSTDELGIYRALAKKPKFANYNDDLLPFDSFRPASGKKVEIQILIPEPDGSLRVVSFDRLEDNIVTPGQGPWTWATLPESVKQKILDAEKNLGDRFGG